MTTRQYTENGLLHAGAILTRAGAITYTRGELGMDGDANAPVTIERTLESLMHPATLDSIRRATITLGHEGGRVTPDNWSERVVGTVVGEPRIAGDVITGDVLVGNREALDRLAKGEDELSIDYGFSLDRAGRKTVGPIMVDNISLVPKGRAGSSVRVLDSAEERMNAEDAKVLADAVAAALDKGSHNMRYMDSTAMDAFKKEMMDAISPVVDGMKQMRDANDAAIQHAEKQKAEAEAREAADALVAQVRGEERERYAVMSDAMPFIAEDKRAALETADSKAILVAAMSDSIPNAADMSVDFLRGALSGLKNARDKYQDLPGKDGLPAGVTQFGGQHNVTDARADAMAKYIEAQTKTYTDAGGR